MSKLRKLAICLSVLSLTNLAGCKQTPPQKQGDANGYGVVAISADVDSVAAASVRKVAASDPVEVSVPDMGEVFLRVTKKAEGTATLEKISDESGNPIAGYDASSTTLTELEQVASLYFPNGALLPNVILVHVRIGNQVHVYRFRIRFPEFNKDSTLFVSSQTYTGYQLGGVVGADTLCQNAARAAGLPDSDKFIAMLTDPGYPFARRYQAYGKIVNTARQVLANDVTELKSGSLRNAILDQNGSAAPGFAWSNTCASGGNFVACGSCHCGYWGQAGLPGMGVHGFENCAYLESGNWAAGGFVGDSRSSSSYEWLFANPGRYTSEDCSARSSLYCIQRHRIERPVYPARRHKIFATSQKFSGNLGGVAGADSQCQQLAQGAGLTGTYKAMLETSDATLPSRIAVRGAVYNTAGELVARNKTELFSASRTPINRDERGTLLGVSPMLTGSRGSDYGVNVNCQNWTSNTGAVAAGIDYSTGAEAFNSIQYNGYTLYECAKTDARFYCIEQ